MAPASASAFPTAEVIAGILPVARSFRFSTYPFRFRPLRAGPFLLTPTAIIEVRKQAKRFRHGELLSGTRSHAGVLSVESPKNRAHPTIVQDIAPDGWRATSVLRHGLHTDASTGITGQARSPGAGCIPCPARCLRISKPRCSLRLKPFRHQLAIRGANGVLRRVGEDESRFVLCLEMCNRGLQGDYRTIGRGRHCQGMAGLRRMGVLFR